MTYAIFTEDGAIMATFHRQHREDRGAYIGLIVGSVDDYEVE